MLTAGIAVDKATLNFDKLFSYKIPAHLIDQVKIGSIAAVPFGRGDTLRLGIVLSIEQGEENEKIKEISDAKAENTTITPYSMGLIKHLKETTFCTWYEAVRTVIPYGALYKISGSLLVPQLVRHTENVYVAIDGVNQSTFGNEKQRAVYSFLLDNPQPMEDIRSATGVSRGVVDTLIKKNALATFQRDKHSNAFSHIKQCRENVALTQQQQEAFDKIISCKDKKPHLLHGVTSSGKSMVFIKLIQTVLDKGGGAMLLVPEISLTPQMIRLLREYFGDIVSVIHSRLSPTEKLLQYNLILNGKAKVVVGTRSAVFAPVQNLQLLIIDEEHERTFKSETSPRYSAIRVAAFISQNTGAKLVLASATPSIESYFLAQKGYCHLHKMPVRYMDLPLPAVEVVDMAQQAKTGDVGPVSRVVLKYLAQNIADEKQSIILINRRGYSTVGVCKDCGKALQCEDCSVNLVRHKQQEKLMCHYCGRSYPVINICPVCGGQINYLGYGTQHIEEYLQAALPEAKILRMDADTTGQNDAHEEMLEAFGKKEYDILIGTQMVAKGLDFKDVSLVCVLGVDASLNQPSYNANEHAFNLITQVVGRAGRQAQGAKAVIQTFDSANPIIELARKGDYEAFYSREIAYRKLNLYPPFCTICTVAFTSQSDVTASKDATTFLNIIKNTVKDFEKQPLVVLGPVPFDVAMVNKTYRWHLSIKCKNNQAFRTFLQNAVSLYLKNKDNKSAIYINFNPVSE